VIELNLKDIAQILNGKLINSDGTGIPIEGVCFDSRSCEKGFLFFALKGERDGHEFAEAAISKGAFALVTEKELSSDIPQIITENTLLALNDLAKYVRSTINPFIVGISGSIGKTTTREMIVNAITTKRVNKPEKHFGFRAENVKSSPGNYNNLIGLPMSILSFNDFTKVAVLELGINQPGEMEKLCETANVDYAVLTRIAPVHLELLGGMKGILKEKLILFEHTIKRNGVCFYNSDDALLADSVTKMNCKKVSFGSSVRSDFYWKTISQGADGKIEFTVDNVRIKMNIMGRHNVYNALAAYSVARVLGLDKYAIAENLSSFTPYSGRMEHYDLNGITLLNDSYNASPESVRASLTVLSDFREAKRYAVLGDMLELGKDELMYHCDVLQAALIKDVDVLLVIGDLFNKAALKLMIQRL
jgi:UDP-N-acetylmuramoyl-tripeptide--D-alanyl-D-alanine ligase